MKVKGFQDTIDWYNQNASKYSLSVQNLVSYEQIEEFIKNVPANSKILDAGCAAGRDTKIIHDLGFKIIGLDITKKLINIAKEKYPEIKFIEGNFLKLPFKDNYFGGIWAHASLLHLEKVEDVIKALSEFYRVLIKDGILHLYVKEKFNKKYDIVKDKLSNHDRFFQYFTIDEIKEYLNNLGYKIIMIENFPDPAGRSEVKWILCLAKK